MRQRLEILLASIREFWAKLNKRQRLALTLVSIAIPVCIAASVIYILTRSGTASKYTALYMDLAPADASAILDELKKTNTPYQLADDGKKILVPRNEVYEKRLEMAKAGLPSRGVAGFELFDKTRLGVTDFTQQVNYQRALEGELSRTIMGMEEVENARVMVVLPEPSLFVTEKELATASVALKLRENKQLNDEQVRGIIHLVAHSIRGLDPKNITVVDTHGNLLSEILQQKRDMRDKMQMTEFQMGFKARIEDRYEEKIRKALSKVLGEENMVVVVTAELDFDVHKTTNEVFEPVVGDRGIVRSEQEISEKYLGTGTVPEIGVPGTTSNIPGYKGLSEGTAEYNREEATRNYEITKKVDEIIKNQGDIERLSVAVMLNEALPSITREDGTLDRRRMEQIRENVAAAANIDFTRGDKVSVISIAFTGPPLRDVALAQEKFRQMMKKIYLGLTLIALILIMLFTYLALRRVIIPEEPEPEIEEFEEDRLEEPVPVEDLLIPELTDEQRMRERMREEVLRMINDDPEGAALIVRSWLFED
ncbi:MAG: flagellar basal-body MS-ring/collar protein FliF [bacterium]